MLFDLGACVTTEIPEPPVCTPVSDCTGRCGIFPDGCGGTVNCMGCPDGETCLVGGVCSDLGVYPRRVKPKMPSVVTERTVVVVCSIAVRVPTARAAA